MTPSLFAGHRVSDFAPARAWYARLLGGQPAFQPHEREAVWELAEGRYVVIEEHADGAGGAVTTIFEDDLEARVAEIASRGVEPAERVVYPGKARKAIYRDPDGNEIAFGGPDAA